ncbi:unnamed protein product [Protopolystoma xenopodis]|uniref:Uncharacterized protein n=1 Tax=Protopolystoma xenopodis TaxID=117903 RepID=A0A3S5FBM7_9PLAT|nr:unnamed protein product [Protopolystoma xenopodis]
MTREADKYARQSSLHNGVPDDEITSASLLNCFTGSMRRRRPKSACGLRLWGINDAPTSSTLGPTEHTAQMQQPSSSPRTPRLLRRISGSVRSTQSLTPEPVGLAFPFRLVLIGGHNHGNGLDTGGNQSSPSACQEWVEYNLLAESL